MMFHGTYTSDFYRAVRNLLHDQAAEPDSPEIARRWNALIDSEPAFRQHALASVAS